MNAQGKGHAQGGGVAMDAVTGSIKIVVRKGSAYTAPGVAGITRPDGVGGEYFMWEGSDGNLYTPGDSVPAGVTSLTAVFEEAVAPTITTTASLPDGTVNEPYSQSLTATGDEPITWSITSGSLPGGLSLVGDTISGAPTAAGTFNFTVKAQNYAGSDTKALSIKIVNAPPAGTAPAITTASLPDGTVNEAYSQTLAATGDAPITWGIISGSLPNGLTLSGNTISGTPTEAGTFNFTVKAQNSAGSDTKGLSITIVGASPTGTAPAITTASLSNGTVNEAYSQSLTATGDTPITWSIIKGSLPGGLTLSGNTISGTPTAAGTFNFTVKAQNSAGSDTKALSIKIVSASPVGTAPSITTASLSDGTVNKSYSQTLEATGDTPIKWSIVKGSLPDGLSLSGDTISGMPITADTFTFTVKAQNRAGSDTKILRIEINPAAPPVTHTITASAGRGGSISPSGEVSVTAGGSQSFTIQPDSS